MIAPSTITRYTAMPKKGYLFIIIAATLWGFIGPFGKIAYAEGISPLEVAFWRAVIAWIFFGAESLTGRKIIRAAPKDILPLALFSILCVATLFGSYQIAVDQGGVALASVLLYTAPAWVIVLSRILLREPITRIKLLALVLTAAGVICIAQGQVKGPNIQSSNSLALAITAGLSSGFCYSLYYILGKFFSDKYSASTLFFYTLLPGALLLLPWFNFVEKSPLAWMSLGLLALISTYGAYHFYYAGLRYIEAGRASIVATLEPVVAALTAWYWWGEVFTVSGYSGAACIILAVFIIVRQKL